MKLTSLQIFKNFFHRKDVYSVQQKSGAYFPVHKKITINEIERHLRGEITLGAYCLDTDETIKWACVDLDGSIDYTPEENKQNLFSLANLIYNTFKDFPRALEFSGRKGFHIWIML